MRCSDFVRLLDRRVDVHVGHAVDHVVPETQIVLERLDVLFQLLESFKKLNTRKKMANLKVNVQIELILSSCICLVDDA